MGTLVDSWVIVIFAEGITAPLWSVTVPRIAPLSTWPNNAELIPSKLTKNIQQIDRFTSENPIFVIFSRAVGNIPQHQMMFYNIQ